MKQVAVLLLAVAACSSSKAENSGPQKITLENVGLTIEMPVAAKVRENKDAEILHLGKSIDLKVKALKSTVVVTVYDKPHTAADTRKVLEMSKPATLTEEAFDGGVVFTSTETGKWKSPHNVDVIREIAGKSTSCKALCDDADACAKLAAACKTLAPK